MPIVGDRPEISVNAIIYATDFSLCSQNAGRYAQLLASRLASPLLVTHAFLLSQPAKEVETEFHSTSQLRKDLEVPLINKARELSTGSSQAIPILLDGIPNEVISALAEKHAPALIVLGTHGAGRIEHGLIGSVAEKILRTTRWPCLIVGPHVPPGGPGALPFRRILYATDLSPVAAHAALYALTFAEADDSAIDVLHVIPEGALGDPERLAELQGTYSRALERLIPERVKEFCSPHTFVETGNAHDRILGHIKEHDISLLVLGLRKTSHLSFEMRTSGAFRLIADSTCPVLTITG